MNETVKNGMNHAVNYGAGGGLAYGIVKLAERFGVAISAEEAIFIASACVWVWHRIRPLFSAVYSRVLKWAGAALIVLVPMTVDASEARLVVDCAEEIEILNGETNQIEKECKRERVYFDMGLRFGGVAFKLNRPREILAGFDAGTGYGIRVRPDWWTFTPSLFSTDIFVNGGYLAREGTDDAVTVGALLVITLFDWIGIGGGISHAFGLGNSPDETTWIGTLGLAKSI